MQNEKLLLIINPVSGDGSAKNWAYDMLNILSGRFKYVTTYISRGVGDIKSAVAENAANYDAVVCAGGDGTLNETLDGVVCSGASPMLGYLPMGTVNDFAHSHGISKNIKTTLHSIVEGEAHEYDLGTLGNRVFSYVAAFGAFTEVSYQTPQDLKSALGRLAYVSEATRRLGELYPIHLDFESGDIKESGDFIYGMITNSKTVGGIKFFNFKNPDFLSDGLIEVTLVRYPQNAMELQEAVTGLLNPNHDCKEVIKLHVSSAELKFNSPVPFTVDGEFGGKYTDVCAGVLPRRIRIIE